MKNFKIYLILGLLFLYIVLLFFKVQSHGLTIIFLVIILLIYFDNIREISISLKDGIKLKNDIKKIHGMKVEFKNIIMQFVMFYTPTFLYFCNDVKKLENYKQTLLKLVEYLDIDEDENTKIQNCIKSVEYYIIKLILVNMRETFFKDDSEIYQELLYISMNSPDNIIEQNEACLKKYNCTNIKCFKLIEEAKFYEKYHMFS